MAERIAIIHSNVAVNLQGKPNTPWFKPDFAKHAELINRVRARKNVFELEHPTDPRTARNFVAPGDVVTIYGLFRDQCVLVARNVMEQKGAIVVDGPEEYSVLEYKP